MISLLKTRFDELIVFGALRQFARETAAPAICRLPAAGAPKTARSCRCTPSTSCRSVTRSRSFSIDGRAISVLPSTTTSTSNSLDGKRRVTSSYWRNSAVSERNNWLSESSTLSRSRPSIAAITIPVKKIRIAIGNRSEISPIRSMPYARRNGFGGAIAGSCMGIQGPVQPDNSVTATDTCRSSFAHST